MRRPRRCCGPRRGRSYSPYGCLPLAAFSFALGVLLALTCSFKLVVVLLAVFLIAVLLAAANS